MLMDMKVIMLVLGKLEVRFPVVGLDRTVPEHLQALQVGRS